MAIEIGSGGFPISNDGSPYIHARKVSYMKQLNVMPKQVISDSEVVDIYKKNKRKISQRLKSDLKLTSVDEGRELLKDIISIYNAGLDHKEGIEKSLREGAMEAVDKIKSANPNYKYKYGLSNTFAFLHQETSALQGAIDELNEITESLEKLDSNVVHLYGQKKNKAFTGGSVRAGGLELLGVDRKSQTSFINLKNNIKKLEAVVATGGKDAKLDPEVSVKMPDGSIEKVKTKGALWGMSQRLINIQGTVLEAVGLANLEMAEEEILNSVKAKLGDKATIKVDANPGGTTFDEVLQRMTTNTSDFSLKVGLNGVDINLGFSAKSQYKVGPKATKSTTFKTTNLISLLTRAGAIGNQIEYRTLNDLAFNRWASMGKNNIRKYLAGAGSYDALGGTVGGDENYFLVYLDKIFTVEEFFDDLIRTNTFLDIDIKGEDKIVSGNVVSFGRKNIARLAGEGPIPGANLVLAYQRSKALRSMIHEMEVQVQLNRK